MIAARVVACCCLVTTPAYASSSASGEFTLQEVQSSEHQLEATFGLDGVRTPRLERRVLEQRIVLYARGLRTDPTRRMFAEGPVKKLVVKQMAKGVVVVFHGRGPDFARLGHIEMRADTKRVHVVVAIPPERNADRKADLLTDSTDALTAQVAMGGDDRGGGKIAEKRHFGPSSVALASTVPALSVAHRPASHSMLPWLATVVLMLAGGLFALKAGRKARRENVDDASIDVLATRILGTRHRLTLVRTGRDKFLLATSREGVQVLGQLKGEHCSPPSAADLSSVDLCAGGVGVAMSGLRADDSGVRCVSGASDGHVLPYDRRKGAGNDGYRRERDVAGILRLKDKCRNGTGGDFLTALESMVPTTWEHGAEVGVDDGAPSRDRTKARLCVE